MSKIFTAIIILSAVIQIIFSFFYSSNIVTQNNHLDEYQNELSQIRLELEQIEKDMADNSSIKKINESTPSANLKNINQSLKIKY